MLKSKKRELRIVFMGTPAFAVAGLSLLLQEGYTIVAVITAPDKPAGRGQKLRESEVKKFALDKGLKILQPTNLKDEKFIEELESLNANLQIVVAFRMLPKVVWQMPTYGTFNLHASLLPEYRGAAPINWAIINGEVETGVTTFLIDEKIDTGQMILQEKVEIEPNENAGKLHDKLMILGAKAILDTVKLIEEDKVTVTKQVEKEDLKSASKLNKDICKINWGDSINQIYNHIRGLSPYPAAWTTLINGQKEISLKIYRANMIIEEHVYEYGKIITTKKEFLVAVEQGFISIIEMQMAGKKKMKIADFLNGTNIGENAFLR
ncbi:methionyl-tRNA formyltransferase [Croceivirga thetidis]|uniref:Methionyl-tRNA formyltransferase n=1 Tax=Croceivirga thetidis TaxID=2721623 RepID=A0ABX1GR10_9FLAO|nr:methionyl-tRNA formyltransferase [Croceivirga thetidis]NKI32058.1 methionyl-tRNA formyltransferase [Croceivirga thetidis]